MKLISDGYKQCLKQKYRDSFRPRAPSWGLSGGRYAGEWVAKIVENYDIKTALDYGCGQATLSACIGGVKWTNYDPGLPEYEKLPEGKYDMVVSSDVLEHIEPPLLDNVIQHKASYTTKIFAADIPTDKTGNLLAGGPYHGHDEHLTVENVDWWQEKISKNLPDFDLISAKAETVILRYSSGRPKNIPPKVRARLIYGLR